MTPRLARHSLRPALAVFSLALYTPCPATAQTAQAAIVGTCADPSGASVPNGSITARNVATNAQFQARTNESGNYVLPLLPVGTYEVTANASGFRSIVRSGVLLQVGDRARVDFVLQIGTAEQKVDVVGEAPLVQTDSSGLGQVVENRRINDLPLNGRNVLALAVLTPGVRNLQGGINVGFGRSQNTQLANIGINGSVSGFTAFLMDGSANTSPGFGEAIMAPLVEAVQEFKVMTNFTPPEYGLTSGAVINTVTKTGTNSFHGSVYEYLRNDKLDARNTFAPTRPVFRFNQFGASAGGPVWLPKLYNGRDKTFFFFNYEGSRNRGASNPITSVPTTNWRAGDFSDRRNAAGALITIYDPETTMPNPNGTGFVRQPFAGNVIPANRMDNVAKNVLPFIPLPNRSPNNAFTQSLNYVGSQPRVTDVNQVHARVDHSFGSMNRMFGRWSYNKEDSYPPDNPVPWPDPIFYARYDNIQNQQAQLSDVHTFSPTLLNEGRLSLMRQDFPFTQASYNQGWPQKIGLPASVPPTLFPLLGVEGYPTLGGNGTTGLRYITSYQLFDMVSKVHGNHSFKFGGDVRLHRYANFQVSAPSGSFAFPASLTGNPQSPGGTGDGLATFLLGQVGSGSLQVNAFPTNVGHSYAFFVGDDWKVTRRLTLNLGLRYDYQSPPVERRNLSSNFNPYVPNPDNRNLMGRMEFAGVDYESTVVGGNHSNFGPRIGFAFDPTGKATTVLRGGFAILYFPTFGVNFFPSNAGFSNTTSYLPPGNNANFAAFRLQDGPPFILQPLGAAGGPSSFLGLGVTFEESRKRTPYSEQWNFGIQHQLPGRWLTDVSYAGNRGISLPSGGYQFNDLDPQFLSLGLQLQDQVPNPLAGQVPGALGNPTVARRQTLLPYPQYSGISIFAPRGGASTYHSLQVKIERRFAQGLTLLVSYTNAKLITDNEVSPISWASALTGSLGAGYQSGKFNRRVERGLDPTDIAQRFVTSFAYELPVGRGKALGIDNGFLNAIAGGWSLSGLFTRQTGQALVVRGAQNFLADRPNSTGQSAKLSDPTRNRWFDTTAFVNPPNYTYGNLGRTLPDVRAPGLTNLDVALLKNTRIWERLTMQFRAEAFNVANVTNLGLPNVTFVAGPDGRNSSATFGAISSAFDARSLQFGIKLLW